MVVIIIKIIFFFKIVTINLIESLQILENLGINTLPFMQSNELSQRLISITKTNRCSSICVFRKNIELVL